MGSARWSGEMWTERVLLLEKKNAFDGKLREKSRVSPLPAWLDINGEIQSVAAYEANFILCVAPSVSSVEKDRLPCFQAGLLSGEGILKIVS